LACEDEVIKVEFVKEDLSTVLGLHGLEISLKFTRAADIT